MHITTKPEKASRRPMPRTKMAPRKPPRLNSRVAGYQGRKRKK